MRSFPHLFTEWQGRIKRSQFWLTVIGLVAAEIVLAILASLLGFAEKHTGTIVRTVDGTTHENSSFTSWTVAPSAMLVISVVLFVPTLAVMNKRRHDRGHSGIDATLIVIAGVVLQLLAVAGIDGGLVDLLGLAYIIGAIYLLIVIGFLRGTARPNQYGAPPL